MPEGARARLDYSSERRARSIAVNLATFILRRRRALGFSKCRLLRTSFNVPSRSIRFFNRRSALSMGSPFLTLISVTRSDTPVYLTNSIRVERPRMSPNLPRVNFQIRVLDSLPEISVAIIQLMKSAYELAMERLEKSQPSTKLSDEKIAKINEIEEQYRAKIAEREIFLKGKMVEAQMKGAYEEMAEFERQLSNDRTNFEAEMEERKQEIRDAKDD